MIELESWKQELKKQSQLICLFLSFRLYHTVFISMCDAADNSDAMGYFLTLLAKMLAADEHVNWSYIGLVSLVSQT